MQKIKVKNVRKLICDTPATVEEDETLPEIALAFCDNPKTRTIYVVDKENRLKGIITLDDIVEIIFPEVIKIETGYEILHTFRGRCAKEIMIEAPLKVRDEDNIEEVLKKMLQNGIEEAPVVDEEDRVIGEINLLEILNVWVEKHII